MANRALPRLLQTPAVILLLLWMLVPLGMTLYFSFIRYVLNSLRRPEWTTPSLSNWRGFGNYEYVLYDAKDFWFAVQNSLFIVVAILLITVVLGLALAILVNRSFPGRGIVRVLLISPFFVMPAVNAVLWINMILDPVLGLNGLAAWSRFRNLTLPHLARPIAIVVMIQSIFHLALYAEIEIVSRGNGNKNLPYLIGEFSTNNIGAASATGIFAVILANIVAIFLLRMVGKNLMD